MGVSVGEKKYRMCSQLCSIRASPWGDWKIDVLTLKSSAVCCPKSLLNRGEDLAKEGVTLSKIFETSAS